MAKITDVRIHARTVEVAPTWSMVSVVRVLRDTLAKIVAVVCIIYCIKLLPSCYLSVKMLSTRLTLEKIPKM